MKKYLIKGLLALVAGGFAASCADKDVDYVPLAQQKSQAYEKAFEEMIGGKVDPNQDWGFESIALPEEDAATRAMTRQADVNSNEWASKGYNVPSAITDREKEVVMTWFRTHENPQSETVNTHNYFIQNVGYTDHTYYAGKDNNGTDKYITNPGTSHMDWIFVGPGYYSNDNGNTTIAYTWDDGDDHVNNFNAGSGQIQHIIYSGSEYFGFHDSQSTGSANATLGKGVGKYCQKNRNFVIRFIEVDGVVGCYVGFNYEAGKDSEGWHLDPDGFFDDRVIKLVAAEGTLTPSTPTPTSETTTTTTQHIKKKVLVVQGRVFCEDLGTVGRKDIDFNDIVFDARIWRISEFDRVTTGSNTVNQNYSADKYEAEICLLAAGGTIPVKLAERNVHDIFQPAAGLTTMVNTVDDHADTDNWVTWENSSAERDPVTFTYDMTAIFKQKGAISLNDIPLEVLWTMGSSDDPSSGYGTMQSVGVLSANLGQVPHKICLPIGTVWPSERRSMDGAYKYFGMWAQNKNSYPEFYKNEGDQVTTAYLYTGKTTGLSLTDANGRSIETNYTSEQVVSSTSTSTVETILWEGSQTYAPESSNNNLTIASVTFNVGDKFRVYGTNGSGSERWITFKDDANQAIVSVNSGIDFSAKGYYSIKVETQDQATKFSNGPLLNIAAQDMTITKITKVSTSSN